MPKGWTEVQIIESFKETILVAGCEKGRDYDTGFTRGSCCAWLEKTFSQKEKWNWWTEGSEEIT